MRHSIPKWALCLTVAISYLHAQATGRLGGVVEDTSGAAVSGAAVVCRNLETGLVHQTLSTDAGVFHFPDLPIGDYEIKIHSDVKGIGTVGGARVRDFAASRHPCCISAGAPVGNESAARILSGGTTAVL